MSWREFIVDGEAGLIPFRQRCSKMYAIREHPLKKQNEHYYESFDWRLYNKGYLCKKWGKTLYLTTIEGDVQLTEIGEPGKHFFPRELPEGQLQSFISPVVGVRALSEILFLKKSSTQFDLLNKDGKTVLRLFYEHGQAIGNGVEEQLVPVLRLVEIKGYEKPFNKILALVKEVGLPELSAEQTFFQRGIIAIGRQVNDYNSGFTLLLENDVTFTAAAARICLHLVRDIEANYAGVLADIDSEFLHDFRVAIRRTRSFLSQFKQAFHGEEIQFLQNELKWLGSLTGPVRDLDVYLLDKPKYMSMLPAELQSGLEEFFIDLGKMRFRRLEEMREGLMSERYSSLMSEWKVFLKNLGKDQKEGQAADGDQLCRPLAIKKIRKRFDKILKDGRKLSYQNPDEDLHRLRIQGKKLRYLLEFFSSLFVEEEIDYFCKHLKKLQNNLGDFNDTSVQLEMLTQSQKDLTGRSKRSIAIAAAIGGLITHLSEEHEKIRKKFEEVFDTFASQKNEDRFHDTLS